jgi:hypothetical protein
MTDIRATQAGWPGVSAWTLPSGTPNRAEHAKHSRPHARPTHSRPAARGHFAREMGLEARGRRVGRNGTLTGDLNVGGSGMSGWKRRLDRACRLGDKAGHTDQGRKDRRSGTVRRLHGAWRRSTGRLMVHRAQGAGFVAAGALDRVRVRRSDPQRHGYKDDGPDLAEQPDRRDRREHPPQMHHPKDTLSSQG